jgi:hypothetical protein
MQGFDVSASETTSSFEPVRVAMKASLESTVMLALKRSTPLGTEPFWLSCVGSVASNTTALDCVPVTSTAPALPNAP